MSRNGISYGKYEAPLLFFTEGVHAAFVSGPEARSMRDGDTDEGKVRRRSDEEDLHLIVVKADALAIHARFW